MRIHHFPLAATALAAALACADGEALAQSAAEPSLPAVRVVGSQDGASEATGQYIVREVDIGKTGQSVRETPQSISVITRQQLDDRNLNRIEDAVRYTTGVTVLRFDGAGNYNTIQSRGFDIGSFQLDGVPIQQNGNYATGMDTAIYDRIEVLRGPAGLLQGAGEPGGSINLVRKRALGLRAIGANAYVGSFGLRRADVDLTGPLNAAGTLRGRLVAVTERRDSHVDTLFADKALGYGTLELDIATGTTLSVGYTAQRIDSSMDQGLPTLADGTLLDLPRSAFAGLRSNRQDLQTRDAFVELEHRLEGGGRVRLSARQVDREAFYRSARAAGAAAPDYTVPMQTVDFAQEARDRNYDLFIAQPFTAAGRDHRLLLGISHNTNAAPGGNAAFGPGFVFDLLNPDYDLPYPAITLPGYSNRTTRTERAGYGQLQIGLTERLRLLAGGRLSWAQAETRTLATGAVTASSKPGRQFTPSVALLYDLNAHLTAYASYVETFVVQSQLDAAGKLLKPRTGKQVEFGLKGEFLNKRLQTHAAIFRIDDVGRAVADPLVPTASMDGGEVRSQGLELEASGQVAPGWDVLAGYAYTDTEYLRAPAAQQGQAFSTVTPRHSVHVGTRYAFRAPALRGWSLGGGANWRSAFHAQNGVVRIASGNYALLHAQLAYRINDQVEVSLAIDNLLDKTYWEKVSGVSRQNFYGEPRRAVLALKARF